MLGRHNEIGHLAEPDKGKGNIDVLLRFREVRDREETTYGLMYKWRGNNKLYKIQLLYVNGTTTAVCSSNILGVEKRKSR